MQRRIFSGKGEEKRGIGGAGGLGGIGSRAQTIQQGKGRRKGTFLAPSPCPSKKDLKKSAVQASVPRRERAKRETRNAWEGG